MSGAWRALGVLAVSAVLATFTSGAAAQDKKAGAAPAPAAKVEPKAGTSKPASGCKGLEQAACGANAECRWIAASVDAKTGKQKRKAYCRKRPASAKAK